MTLAELELQLCEQTGALKRRRIESIQFCYNSLEALGADERDKLRTTDMIRTVAFGATGASTDQPQDKEICIRELVNAAGRARESPGIDQKVGKLAKEMYLAEHPEYVFPKKNIYCQGQLISANMWTESQKSFIEKALASL